MPSKYDTNPLDPDFPEKIRAESETRVLSETGAAETRNFGPAALTEEQQTVRLPGGSQQQYAAPPPPPQPYYQQPYNGQYVPGAYQPQGFAAPSDRKIAPIGLPENVVTALPYIPWYIGMVAALVILFLTPRTETKVRFHAAQGLAAHVGILLLTSAFGFIGMVSGAARAGGLIVGIAASIMLIVWAIKAWKGRPVHIQIIEGLTNWLEDKIHKPS